MRNNRSSWLIVSLAATVLAALGMLAYARGASADGELPGCHFAPMAGVVSDTATHLNWQQASAGMVYSWDDAWRYCATLDLHGMGWRLPSVKELHTLVDASRAMPAADPVAFPGTAADYYWTSSQVATFSNEAWAVSFAYGYDAFFDVQREQHVRCVR